MKFSEHHIELSDIFDEECMLMGAEQTMEQLKLLQQALEDEEHGN